MLRTDRRKAQAAVLGGTALIAMGIIAGATGGAPDGATAVVSGGSMQTGETTTLSYATGTVAPVKAVPAVKATPH